MSLQVMHLAALRKRRAIAISSRQHVAHLEQKSISAHSVKGGGLSLLGTESKAFNGSTTSGIYSGSTAATASLKKERRAQIKLDVMHDAVEAVDILQEQQNALSVSVSRSSLSPLSSPDGLDQARALSQLVLGDVAVTRPPRRSGE